MKNVDFREISPHHKLFCVNFALHWHWKLNLYNFLLILELRQTLLWHFKVGSRYFRTQLCFYYWLRLRKRSFYYCTRFLIPTSYLSQKERNSKRRLTHSYFYLWTFDILQDKKHPHVACKNRKQENEPKIKQKLVCQWCSGKMFSWNTWLPSCHCREQEMLWMWSKRTHLCGYDHWIFCMHKMLRNVTWHHPSTSYQVNPCQVSQWRKSNFWNPGATFGVQKSGWVFMTKIDLWMQKTTIRWKTTLFKNTKRKAITSILVPFNKV